MRSLEIPLRSSNCREANEKNVGSTRPKKEVLEMFFVSGSLTLIPASVVSVRTWKILSPAFSKITLICLSPYCAVAPPFPPEYNVGSRRRRAEHRSFCASKNHRLFRIISKGRQRVFIAQHWVRGERGEDRNEKGKQQFLPPDR